MAGWFDSIKNTVTDYVANKSASKIGSLIFTSMVLIGAGIVACAGSADNKDDIIEPRTESTKTNSSDSKQDDVIEIQPEDVTIIEE